MARKSPSHLYAQNFNSTFKKTKLQASLYRNYQDSKANFGSNSETLKDITDIAGNIAYSHSKRLTKINEALSGKDLTDAERNYAQSVLNTQYQYIKSTAQEGRKVKDFSETAKRAYNLRNNIQQENGYTQFEERTSYLGNNSTTIPTKITKPADTLSDLENIFVKADFTVPKKQTRTGIFVKLAASILIGATMFYTAYKLGSNSKEVIEQLQAENAELQSQTNSLGNKISKLHANQDTIMGEFMALKDKYNDATNTSHNLSTNLTALTAEHNIAKDNLANVIKDYGNATNQVTELQGYLLTEKTNTREAEEKARLTAKQLEAEKKAHNKTGNQLTRTRGKLESANTNYNDALSKNAQLSADLDTYTRKLATEKSNLADRLIELETVRSNLTFLAGRYTASTNQAYTLSTNLYNTQKQLALTNKDLTETLFELDEGARSLRLLSLEHTKATNNLAFTKKELGRHTDLQTLEAEREARRVEDAKIVDQLVGSAQVEFPLIVAEVNKRNKRLENVKEVVFYGDGFIDTFPELKSFASAIGNTFASTNYVNDATLPTWFGGTKLSDVQIKRVLEQVPRNNLLSLGGFLEATKENPGMINFTNADGKAVIMGPKRRLNEILGDRR